MRQFEEAKTAEGSNGPLGTRTSGGSESGVAGTLAGVVGSATGEVILITLTQLLLFLTGRKRISCLDKMYRKMVPQEVWQTAHIIMYPKNNSF